MRDDVQAVRKVAGKNVTIDEHPGKGTVINANRDRPGTTGGGGGACAHPSIASTFSIRWQVQYGGMNGAPDRDDTQVGIYTLDNMPVVSDFFPGVITPQEVTWIQSYGDDWCNAWACGPGCSPGPGDTCNVIFDDGDWCEGFVPANLFHGALRTFDDVTPCESGSDMETRMALFLRWGTVGTDTGWHMVCYADSKQSSSFLFPVCIPVDATSGPGGSLDFPNYINVFLGATLAGTFSTTAFWYDRRLAAYRSDFVTYIWTISQP